MNTWIETKVSFDKKMDNGYNKRVNEMYLINALSCTEAEANVAEELKTFISGTFDVQAVKKSNITEVFDKQYGDRWYKVKVMYITEDDKGKEKKEASYMLISADSFKEALDNFLEEMKDTVMYYEIACIQETKFVDVFDYRAS